MKLDLDMSVFSRLFGRITSEFGQKRLWPVAAVLLAAIVAVPVLLSNSASPSSPQASLPAIPPASGTSLPTINAQATPTTSHLTGSAHNPFATSASAASSVTSSGGTSIGSGGTSTLGVGSTVTGASSTGTSTGSTGTSGAGSSTVSSGGTGSTPPSITGNSKPKPAPTGLSSTQSYDVAMAITNADGGVDTFGQMARLSAVPDSQRPLLVELGVLQGGKRVLFAVQPGTVINGPGTCTPGPIDCEVLSLSQDETESVSSQGGGATLFAVTAITAVGHSSAAAADRARQAASAFGRAVVDRDGFSLPALSLFKYESSTGSVVDLRNLTVEG